MSGQFSVFLLGATGYIGGSFLTGLHAAYPGAHITALVRSDADKGVTLAAGAESVVGSHEDLDVIRSAAKEADVVINAADSDNVVLAKALIEAMTARKAAMGRTTLFVHVSGVALVAEHVEGNISAAKLAVSDDLDEAGIRAIPPTAIHREVDDLIFAADSEGTLSGYIIAPGLVYGAGTGPKKTLCQIFPTVLAVVRKNGELSYVGEGTNIWDDIHITDFTDLFVRVLQRGLNNADAGKSAYAKFYWAVARPFEWGAFFQTAAKALHAHGVLQTAEAISVSVEEATKVSGMLAMITSTNARAVSGRARSIGWAPKASGILDYVPEGIATSIAHPHLGTVVTSVVH